MFESSDNTNLLPQIQFRVVAVVAGNADNLSGAEYDRRHVMILSDMLETLKPQYIVGTCSFKAGIEKQPALDYKTIVFSQVGPPGFYTDDNPYVFGFHLNSDVYPSHTVRQLVFSVSSGKGTASQPIKVIYRTKSEFFFSTCNSAIDEARKSGFTDLDLILYDHEADEDNDGIINEQDMDFLYLIADRACPPGSGENVGFHPAIFMCVRVEQDMILERFRQNGCRPNTLWDTPSTWGWAKNNQGLVSYFNGGGQWHEAFQYSDRYFPNGKAVLDFNEEMLGYYGNYDMVVSYAVPVLYSQHIQASYRIEDNPTVLEDFSSEIGYEKLRRDLLVLSVDTIFGPFVLDNNQRNTGRGAAGTQWLPDNSTESGIRNKLVSPSLQAEALSHIPSETAKPCDPGNYVNEQLILDEECILCSKCDDCPIDTFAFHNNELTFCHTCPEGTSTELALGSTFCIQHDESLLSPGLLGFGYTLTTISWGLAVFFFAWIIKYRKDPVVRISQYEFLILLCLGAFLSTSTIVALSFQAGVHEDTSAATVACQAAPFLYTIGWVAQYGSLLTKSYRLYRMMNNPHLKRIKISSASMFKIIAVLILLDLIVVTVWTIVSPLEYRRENISMQIDEERGVKLIHSVGSCRPSGSISPIPFFGVLFFLHASIMVITNVLLYKIRNVNNRYQEQRYVALASVYVCEIILIGIPVVFAAGDNESARYTILLGIIFLNDAGILCFIFIPKILFQRKGLPEGVTVSESIQNKQFRKSIVREASKARLRESWRSSNASAADVSSYPEPEDETTTPASNVFESEPIDDSEAVVKFAGEVTEFYDKAVAIEEAREPKSSTCKAENDSENKQNCDGEACIGNDDTMEKNSYEVEDTDHPTKEDTENTNKDEDQNDVEQILENEVEHGQDKNEISIENNNHNGVMG